MWLMQFIGFQPKERFKCDEQDFDSIDFANRALKRSLKPNYVQNSALRLTHI